MNNILFLVGALVIGGSVCAGELAKKVPYFPGTGPVSHEQLLSCLSTQKLAALATALYFWIRKDDLRACRFENVWMISQCY